MRSAANPQLANLRDDLVRALEARVPVAVKRVSTDAAKVAPLLASIVAARQVASRLLDVEAAIARGAPPPSNATSADASLTAERDALIATLAGLVRDLQTPA